MSPKSSRVRNCQPKILLTQKEKILFAPIIKDGKYTPIRLLGKGTFGTVVEAYCNTTNKLVAIKRMSSFEKYEYTMV